MDLSAPRSSDQRSGVKENNSPVSSAGTLPVALEVSSAPASSTSSASSTSTSSSLLASIYLSPPKVPTVTVTSSGSGRKEVAESENPHSGMLQAYLTEKALKEGLMKRQQLKESLPAGSGNLPDAPPAILTDLIRPNVIREMNATAATSACTRPMPVFSESLTGRGRPEFVIPSSGSGFGTFPSSLSLISILHPPRIDT